MRNLELHLDKLIKENTLRVNLEDLKFSSKL